MILYRQRITYFIRTIFIFCLSVFRWWRETTTTMTTTPMKLMMANIFFAFELCCITCEMTHTPNAHNCDGGWRGKSVYGDCYESSIGTLGGHVGTSSVCVPLISLNASAALDRRMNDSKRKNSRKNIHSTTTRFPQALDLQRIFLALVWPEIVRSSRF